MIFNNPMLLFTGFLSVYSTGCGFASKTYRRAWRISSALLWSSLLCLFMEETNTTIEENGVLHELWPLPVLTALLFCIGALQVVVLGILHGYRFAKRRWRLRSDVI